MKKFLYLLLPFMALAGCSEDSFENGSATPPNNQIWYTSTYGDVLLPNKSDEFGTKILSNIYENGKGVITFGDEVKYIGQYAFEECEGLKQIVIPESVTVIERDAFSGCSSLQSITIPENVTKIGWYTFRDCSSLKIIIIPESVTEIGYYAFENCSSLHSVHCLSTIPPTAKLPGDDWHGFDHNAPSRKIYVPIGSGDAYKAADGWKDYADAIEEKAM